MARCFIVVRQKKAREILTLCPVYHRGNLAEFCTGYEAYWPSERVWKFGLGEKCLASTRNHVPVPGNKDMEHKFGFYF